jgi:hypothetical protein
MSVIVFEMEVTKMLILLGKIFAGISLFVFGFATWIGFAATVNDPKAWETKLKNGIDRLLGNGSWLKKPFVLTKIGLIIGFVFGIVSMCLW